MKSIEVIKLGATRRGLKILSPGTYDLCRNNEHVILRVRCSIETTEVFDYRKVPPLVGFSVESEPRWHTSGYHIDTLKVLPTWWERVKALALRREQPLPRAITIVDRSAIR